MKKDIYKIENKLNGKVYIGQSNNPQRRFREHIAGDHEFSVIHQALIKYGINNFDFSIIEHDVEDYNEREKYWIAYYQSNDRSKGYNLTPGGDEPPVLAGENSPFVKFSDEIILQVTQDILNTNLSLKEIATKYNMSPGYIGDINRGWARPIDGFIYPLREIKNLQLKDDRVNEIIYYLKYINMSTGQIARILQINTETVLRINKGERHKLPDEQYPIRFLGTSFSHYMIDHIIQDILDAKLKFCDIEKKYNVSKSTVNRINNGKIFKISGLDYPLRKSYERIYY